MTIQSLSRGPGAFGLWHLHRGAWLLAVCCLLFLAPACESLEPVPDKLVVLTFDDATASHYTVARPILKRYGFSATFFITEGFTFLTNKKDYMTWAQIAELHRDGFEIGNHTRTHLELSPENLDRLEEELEGINARCREYDIPRPTSFSFPGNIMVPHAIPVLKEMGIRFARRGGGPEYPNRSGLGFAYEPGLDHPLLIPSAGNARPTWELADFRRAADQARDGKIAVIQFHGVPDNEHLRITTPPGRFAEYMTYLHDNGFTAIALRDLARYVNPRRAPRDPMAIIERRKALVDSRGG